MFKIKATNDIVIDSKEFSEYMMLKACSSKFRADAMFSINTMASIMNEVSNIIDGLEVKDLRDFSVLEDKKELNRVVTKDTTTERKKAIPVKYRDQDFSSIAELCRSYHASYCVVKSRIDRGWSVEKAIETKVKNWKYKDHFGFKYASLADMCIQYRTTPRVFRKRKTERPDLGVKYCLTGEE